MSKEEEDRKKYTDQLRKLKADLFIVNRPQVIENLYEDGYLTEQEYDYYKEKYSTVFLYFDLILNSSLNM